PTVTGRGAPARPRRSRTRARRRSPTVPRESRPLPQPAGGARGAGPHRSRSSGGTTRGSASWRVLETTRAVISGSDDGLCHAMGVAGRPLRKKLSHSHLEPVSADVTRRPEHGVEL